MDASWKLALRALAFPCDDLRSLWSTSNLNTSRHKFFTVWPSNPSQHKLSDVHSFLEQPISQWNTALKWFCFCVLCQCNCEETCQSRSNLNATRNSKPPNASIFFNPVTQMKWNLKFYLSRIINHMAFTLVLHNFLNTERSYITRLRCSACQSQIPTNGQCFHLIGLFTQV